MGCGCGGKKLVNVFIQFVSVFWEKLVAVVLHCAESGGELGALDSSSGSEVVAMNGVIVFLPDIAPLFP